MKKKNYRSVFVLDHPQFSEQMCKLGQNHWSVARLVMISKDFDVFDAPLQVLNIYHQYNKLTLRDMVMHMKAVNNADLSCPIILDEDGDIMDGRHRVMRALLDGETTIKAVRFDVNPIPCRVDD